jgi:hypothetical protein
LEISVETFSTGKVCRLGEEDISENTFFPGPSSRSISFTDNNMKTNEKLILPMGNTCTKTLSPKTETNK